MPPGPVRRPWWPSTGVSWDVRCDVAGAGYLRTVAAEPWVLLDDVDDLAELVALMLLSPGESSLLDRVADLRPRWWSRAACRGVGVNIFFDPAQADRAVEICNTCEVIGQCRRAGQGEDGVWGGRRPPEPPTPTGRIGVCGDCREATRLQAKGLCGTCYRRHHRRARKAAAPTGFSPQPVLNQSSDRRETTKKDERR